MHETVLLVTKSKEVKVLKLADKLTSLQVKVLVLANTSLRSGVLENLLTQTPAVEQCKAKPVTAINTTP